LVEEGDEAQPLRPIYSKNSEDFHQVFDLIVVLTKPKASLEQRTLKKKLE
jgi:hypothetical protein